MHCVLFCKLGKHDADRETRKRGPKEQKRSTTRKEDQLRTMVCPARITQQQAHLSSQPVLPLQLPRSSHQNPGHGTNREYKEAAPFSEMPVGKQRPNSGLKTTQLGHEAVT
eukprot:4769689-Amphidinium_carterae.1